MSKPLEGIKIIDFTHVQAGPACTQLLAWFGADVIKVERPGAGDVTRSQLRDIPDADALYFTMLNSNKRSLTLDTKTKEGKEIPGVWAAVDHRSQLPWVMFQPLIEKKPGHYMLGELIYQQSEEAIFPPLPAK